MTHFGHECDWDLLILSSIAYFDSMGNYVRSGRVWLGYYALDPTRNITKWCGLNRFVSRHPKGVELYCLLDYLALVQFPV